MTISARWWIFSYPTLTRPVRALQSTGKSKTFFTWHYALVKNSFIFKVYFHYGLIQIGVITLVGISFAALWNLIGVWIDMKRPKLEWTNETEAIKHNVNVVLSILLCIAISVGYFFAVTKMLQNGFPAGGIITFLLCSVCILILLVCKGIASHQE